jgi:hypothetical protein
VPSSERLPGVDASMIDSVPDFDIA